MVTNNLEHSRRWKLVRSGVKCLLVVAIMFGQHGSLRADDPCGCGEKLADDLKACADDFDLDEKRAVTTVNAANKKCYNTYETEFKNAKNSFKQLMIACSLGCFLNPLGCLGCGALAMSWLDITLMNVENTYENCKTNAKVDYDRDIAIATDKRAACEKKAGDRFDSCKKACKPI